MKLAAGSSTTSRILKAMSVFGGVQVITILCSVVRTKLVAIWIGPLGVGIITLFNSTLDLLTQTTQLNLRQSAVRDIAAVASDSIGLPVTAGVVRRLGLLLGIGGALICAMLSPLLSRWAFGSGAHTLDFIILSLTLLLSGMTVAEHALMQGTGHLKALAGSTLRGAVASTVAALPLFYYLRLRGIVPVLLCFAFFTWLFSRLRRVRTRRMEETMPVREVFSRGRDMLSLGMYMTVSSAMSLGVSYLFVIYLNRFASTEAVGIFQSGYTLVNTYVGVIFTAIAMEYFPRLTSVAMRPSLARMVVSHEVSVTLKVLMPLVVCFICTDGLIVRLLYTDSFLPMIPYVSTGIIGTFLRAVSWCMAFTILARGDGRLFVLTEGISAVVMLTLNILGFRLLGYQGLGIAYVLWYAVYTAVVYAVFRRSYGMTLSRGIPGLTAIALAIGTSALLLRMFIGPWLTAIIILLPTSYLCLKSILRRSPR